MRSFALLLLGLALCATTARSEEIVAGLSQSRVSITANFDGSEILIFGAVKRSAPVSGGAPPLEVAVAVAGPSEPITVRRKERRFGIWVNADAVEVDSAPSFYAVATSAPLFRTLSHTENLRHGVTPRRAIRAVGAPMVVPDAMPFVEALIRIRQESGLYQIKEETVEISEETLFSTSVALPANLTEGVYTVRIFVTRGGEVIDTQTALLEVSKVGLERWIYTLAHERPLAYGILSLTIAILAGWGASAVFRYIRV